MGARIDAQATIRALADIQKRTDRATMYALRAAARTGKQAARRATPVYKGDDPRAQKGLLRASIHTSRRLRRTGPPPSYAVHIGPWGQKVNLYRSKIEDQEHMMQRAYEQAAAAMAEKFAATFRRVMEKR